MCLVNLWKINLHCNIFGFNWKLVCYCVSLLFYVAIICKSTEKKRSNIMFSFLSLGRGPFPYCGSWILFSWIDVDFPGVSTFVNFEQGRSRFGLMFVLCKFCLMLVHYKLRFVKSECNSPMLRLKYNEVFNFIVNFYKKSRERKRN